MLVMYRGQSQETTPSLFSTRDEGYTAEDLPRMGGPPKEAAFRLRFGQALLASTALHILLLLLVPGIPYHAAVPVQPEPAMLTVSLTSQVPLPSQSVDQPIDHAEPSQAAMQPPLREVEPAMPAAPAVPPAPAEPSMPTSPPAPITPAVHPEPTPASTEPRDGPQTSETLGPSTNPGTAARVPDAARIGEEFKQAFMKLLAYPEAARRRGVQGTVGLRIIMESDGRIIEALVSQTSGSSMLDRAAVSAALATPGPLGGPGRRLELAIRISFEAGRVLARP